MFTSPSLNPKRRRFFIFAAAFVLLIVGVLATYVWWANYRVAKKIEEGSKRVEALAESLKRAEQEDYERALADTYGGKTPQETLRLYIEAVEKGDYEGASRYLIENKQEEELKKLNNSRNNPKDLETYIGFIKNARPWRSSLEDKEFVMEAKTDLGPSIFVRFIRYPNNVWKIVEI